MLGPAGRREWPRLACYLAMARTFSRRWKRISRALTDEIDQRIRLLAAPAEPAPEAVP